MFGRRRVKNDPAVTQFGQLNGLWVHRIDHSAATGQHHINLGARDLEVLLGIQDVEVAQAFFPADIRDHADLATVIGQALPQNRGARVLKNGGLYGAVHQDALSRVPGAAVSGVHLTAVQVQALGTC